jgi:bifunctional UDP-N-acetylglucosamine pyrophosphorylase/glucosamine-1-phosphate N-acetyltransferase
MNEEIESLIKETEELISKGKVFEYWKLIEKGEAFTEKLENANFGTIEQGVLVIGKLYLGKGAIVKSGTRIEGNVYIGEECTVGPNAFLRNGTILAPRVHVGTSEIKNSIILSGTKIPHYSYVGDSVIGRNCNFGAGTKIANLRHDGNTIKVEINWEVQDSGRKKLGALVFDNVKTGVNSAINCGAVLMPNSIVFPCEFKK